MSSGVPVIKRLRTPVTESGLAQDVEVRSARPVVVDSAIWPQPSITTRASADPQHRGSNGTSIRENLGGGADIRLRVPSSSFSSASEPRPEQTDPVAFSLVPRALAS